MIGFIAGLALVALSLVALWWSWRLCVAMWRRDREDARQGWGGRRPPR